MSRGDAQDPRETPADGLFFDDIEVGARWDLGEASFELDEMIDFARRYDPEPFHIDEAWSRDGPFGEIIASGLLTLGKCRVVDQRHFARLNAQGLVAAGFESLRFLTPARAGDRMRVSKECIAKRASRSKPDRGILTFRVRAENQRGEVLLEFEPTVMFRRRPRP